MARRRRFGGLKNTEPRRARKLDSQSSQRDYQPSKEQLDDIQRANDELQRRQQQRPTAETQGILVRNDTSARQSGSNQSMRRTHPDGIQNLPRRAFKENRHWGDRANQPADKNAKDDRKDRAKIRNLKEQLGAPINDAELITDEVELNNEEVIHGTKDWDISTITAKELTLSALPENAAHGRYNEEHIALLQNRLEKIQSKQLRYLREIIETILAETDTFLRDNSAALRLPKRELHTDLISYHKQRLLLQFLERALHSLDFYDNPKQLSNSDHGSIIYDAKTKLHSDVLTLFGGRYYEKNIQNTFDTDLPEAEGMQFVIERFGREIMELLENWQRQQFDQLRDRQPKAI